MPDPTIQCPHCGQLVTAYAAPGQSIQCPNCNNVFARQPDPIGAQPAYAQTVGYATPAGYGGPLRPNGAATFSLICGIFFFFLIIMGMLIGFNGGGSPAAAITLGILALLAPILAVTFGIIGLVKTRSGEVGGKARAITGVSLGGVGVLLMLVSVVGVGLLTPSLGRSRETANRVKCAANLKQIGLAMQLYANENKGQYPLRPEDLILTQDITPEVFICPSSNDTKAPGATEQQQAANLSTGGHHSYIYLGAGKNSATPANVIVVYEPMTNHQQQGFNALFADGHADFILPASVAKQVQAELQAGKNPPPSLPKGF